MVQKVAEAENLNCAVKPSYRCLGSATTIGHKREEYNCENPSISRK
jgi:hypothetical protein